MSYRTLTIWQEARICVIDVHKMTLTKLPTFELYEEGSQIRRSIKSVKSNIVEGYGRRRYKQDYIRFLTYSQASCDETTDHLETLYETGSLTDEPLYALLHQNLQTLGKKINRFIQTVEKQHQASSIQHQASSIQKQAASCQLSDTQHPDRCIQQSPCEATGVSVSAIRQTRNAAPLFYPTSGQKKFRPKHPRHHLSV